jgi:thioredoxin-related protein
MAPTDNQRRVPRWLAVIVVALVAVRVAMLYVKRAAPSQVHWVTIADAPRVSAATHKPILYEFSAEWCGPCKRLEQDIANDKALTARINNAYVPVRVVDRLAEEGANPRDIAELQRAYQVRSFPTIVVVDPSGVVRARDEGYSGRDDFAKLIEEHAARESH